MGDCVCTPGILVCTLVWRHPSLNGCHECSKTKTSATSYLPGALATSSLSVFQCGARSGMGVPKSLWTSQLLPVPVDSPCEENRHIGPRCPVNRKVCWVVQQYLAFRKTRSLQAQGTVWVCGIELEINPPEGCHLQAALRSRRGSEHLLVRPCHTSLPGSQCR